MSTNYHHGNLPAALRNATAELVAERGTGGFSLREVARRAGVSHAAPAHHFGDARGLLTAVAAEGFDVLSEQMENAAADIDDSRQRLHAIGVAYVETALRMPGHFRIMLQNDLCDPDDEALILAGARAYEALSSAIRAIRDELSPELDVEVASLFAWSVVQGLVVIGPNLDHMDQSVGTSSPPVVQIIDRFADYILEGIAR